MALNIVIPNRNLVWLSMAYFLILCLRIVYFLSLGGLVYLVDLTNTLVGSFESTSIQKYQFSEN